jgi:hypothetical protein
MKTYEVAWSEIDRRGNIITKRKAFSNKKAFEKFLAAVAEKDNFHSFYGTREF